MGNGLLSLIKRTDISPNITHFKHKINRKGPKRVHIFGTSAMGEQKIKQDIIIIGSNIRRIRKEKGIGQTELVRRLQLMDVSITREALVKIERGIQHIYAGQLKAIKEALETDYEELFK